MRIKRASDNLQGQRTSGWQTKRSGGAKGI